MGTNFLPTSSPLFWTFCLLLLPTPIPLAPLLPPEPFPKSLRASSYLGIDRGFLEIISTAYSDVDAARIGDTVLGHTRNVPPICVVGSPTALKLGE